jgi:cation:H+ antiporter
MADESQDVAQEENGPNRTGLRVAIGILIGYVMLRAVSTRVDHFALSLATLLAEVSLVSVVIWQACDPFADAAQWIGKTFRLPGSVRGATLDAVASSMPELFSGIFFVVLAVSAAEGGGEQARIAAGAEGFGSTIATCAGSAVYNMILIPAFCALVISIYRPSRPTIDVVGCSGLLVVFLLDEQMSWWMGVVFLVIYLLYIVHLYRDAKRYRGKMSRLSKHFETHGHEVEVESVIASLSAEGVRVSRALVIHAQEMTVSELAAEADDDEGPKRSAGVFFGYFDFPLNHLTAAIVIVMSTIVAAAACYFLVLSTRGTASLLEVPTFFVAVILAAAASSVPDTFLAIGAARHGDDSGAVSNAFGSNIFDICIGISIPLFVNSYLNGGEPVSLLENGKPMAGLVVLRVMLIVLGLITLAIMWHKRQLTRTKAIALCVLYLVFIAYAVLGSLGLIG